MSPVGVVIAPEAFGVGDVDPGVAGICAFTGGLTPPGAEVPLPKLP